MILKLIRRLHLHYALHIDIFVLFKNDDAIAAYWSEDEAAEVGKALQRRADRRGGGISNGYYHVKRVDLLAYAIWPRTEVGPSHDR